MTKIRTAEEIAVGYTYYRATRWFVKTSWLPLLLIWLSILFYIAWSPRGGIGLLALLLLFISLLIWVGILVVYDYLANQYHYVDTEQMLNIGEQIKILNYSKLQDDLCCILRVRPKLTVGEHSRLSFAIEMKIREDQQAAMNAERVAQAVVKDAKNRANDAAWKAMQQRLQCKDSASS